MMNAAGPDSSLMPVLFVGHGNPMNAVEDTSFAAAWRETAARIPRPKAILCISAHWETEGSFVTAMAHPRTIHDFYGFPDALYRVQYPAPGSPELAERVRELVSSTAVRPDEGYSWGLDHGAWSVLRRMYSEADIPVVQLSLDRTQHPRFHYDLAAELSPLRREGVLVVASGNLVHNLRLLEWDAVRPYPWAAEFDSLATELILSGEHDRLVAYPALGEAARLAIPTNEHYLPLLYALALQQPGEEVAFFAEGVAYGSISMRSLRIG
ncbi:MAG TPA: 4,5-DOPA dioxygenase extradiol [Geobacteraceae bacterium]|jgi:4,5-DOPA dioxygenase extradiol